MSLALSSLYADPDHPIDSSEVIAILCSDLHLSHKPPVARSCEQNWYDAMHRVLLKLRQIVNLFNQAPVLFAGDLFDSWRTPAELINFAITRLPRRLYAIAGQHDLLYHRCEEIEKTPYWTLVKANAINNVVNSEPSIIESNGVVLEVYGSHWRQPTPVPRSSSNIKILLKHAYVWTDGYSYQHAKISSKIDSIMNELEGYDVCVFGDNHKHFIINRGGKVIVNCGTMMRRKIDEYNYKPVVTLLTKNLKTKTIEIERKFSMITEELTSVVEPDSTLMSFITALKSYEEGETDFINIARRWCKTTHEKEAAELLESYLEEALNEHSR